MPLERSRPLCLLSHYTRGEIIFLGSYTSLLAPFFTLHQFLFTSHSSCYYSSASSHGAALPWSSLLLLSPSCSPSASYSYNSFLPVLFLQQLYLFPLSVLSSISFSPFPSLLLPLISSCSIPQATLHSTAPSNLHVLLPYLSLSLSPSTPPPPPPPPAETRRGLIYAAIKTFWRRCLQRQTKRSLAARALSFGLGR